MTRLARVVVPGFPYHITARGNRKQQIFFSDDDRAFYLALLGQGAREEGMEILAYGLMINHVHLVAVPESAKTFAHIFKRVQRNYAAYVNHRMGWCGHLWQDRYFSSALDERHMWAAIKYSEDNAVRAKIVKRAQDYRWSSAPARWGLRRDRLLTTKQPWVRTLSNKLADSYLDEIGTLKVNIRQNSPSGDGEFCGVMLPRLQNRDAQICA